MAGEYDTSFLETFEKPALRHDLVEAAIVGAVLFRHLEVAPSKSTSEGSGVGLNPWKGSCSHERTAPTMKYVVQYGGDDVEVEVHETEDGQFEIQVGDRLMRADFERSGSGQIFSLILGGHSYELLISRDGDHVAVVNHGRGIEFQVESERERNARLIAGDGGSTDGEKVTAIMPGIVVSVAVASGDSVVAGDAVCVLEAMKMENEIRASSSGVVKEVVVEAGQTVNAGDLLVDIGPAEED